MSTLVTLFKRFNETKWHDVSLVTKLMPINLDVKDKFVTFNLVLSEPVDSNGVAIIPVNEDEICICSDNTFTEVLGNCLSGNCAKIDDEYQGLVKDESRPYTLYHITVMQLDPGLSDIIINNLVSNKLNDLLPLVLQNCRNNLGGYLDNNTFIPKFTNYAENVSVSPISLQSDNIAVLSEILKKVGYDFAVEYYIRPDPINTIKRVQTIAIYNSKTGYKTISNDWAMGVTFQAIKDTVLFFPELNNYIRTEKSLLWSSDATVRKNWINFKVKIKNLTNLSTYTEISENGTKDTFNIGLAYDIKYTCLKLECSILSVISTTQFVIPANYADSLDRSATRLYNNNLNTKLVCLILPSVDNPNGLNTKGYYRQFTINKTTNIITLIADGEGITANANINGLLANDTFNLRNSFDVIPENSQLLPTDAHLVPQDLDGFVTKHITKDSELSYVKFTVFDKPDISQSVVVTYYPISSNPQLKTYPDSINKWGIKSVKEEFNAPIAAEEFQSLVNEYQKFTIPLETVKFVSYRPTLCRPGWQIPVNIPRTNKNFICISNNVTHIAPDGPYQGKTFFQQEMELALYTDNLTELLASLQNYADVEKSKLDQKNEEIFYSTLEFVSSFGETKVLTALVALNAINITDTGFRARWTAYAGATSFVFLLFKPDGSSVPGYGGIILDGNTNYIDVTGLDISITYKYKLQVLKDGVFSAFSNIITTVLSSLKTFSSFIKNHASLSILYDQVAMTGSGLSITDSKNSVVANFYKNTTFDANSAYPTWVADTRFGNGIKISTNASALRISDNELIETPTKGTWIFIIKFFNKINQTLLNKSSLLAESLQSYQLSITSTGQLQGELTNADNSVHGNPKYFISSSDSSFINDADLNNIIGLAFKYDVVAKTLSMIKNQTIYTWHDINPPYAGISSIYSVLNSSVDLFLGDYIFDNGDRYISGYGGQFEIYGMAMIKENLSDAQIKSEFANMGLA